MPSYTETVLDDHDGYTTTDWLDVTARFIPWLQITYLVAPARVYGTGQSMGCMIHLVLAGRQRLPHAPPRPRLHDPSRAGGTAAAPPRTAQAQAA